jgi:hypothetical protein
VYVCMYAMFGHTSIGDLKIKKNTYVLLKHKFVCPSNWNNIRLLNSVSLITCKQPVLEFSRQILEKSTNIKFHENPSSGSRVVPCGRTDRHDEANSRFSKFTTAPKGQ